MLSGMTFNRWLALSVAGSVLAGFLLGGGLIEEAGAGAAADATASVPPPADAAVPAEATLGPVFTPIWARGRVTGFVAAEIGVRFGESAAGQPQPAQAILQDRMLEVLYRAGAEGRLNPGAVQVDRLEADLLAATRRDGVVAVRLGKLIHQENRQP